MTRTRFELTGETILKLVQSDDTKADLIEIIQERITERRTGLNIVGNEIKRYVKTNRIHKKL